MAFLLICVRTEDTILDKVVYSKDLAPVKFDNWEVGLALRHDPCTNSAQYFVIHCVPEKILQPAVELEEKPTVGLDEKSHKDLNNSPGTRRYFGRSRRTRPGSDVTPTSRLQSNGSTGTTHESHMTSQGEENAGKGSECACKPDKTGNNPNCKSCIKIVPKLSFILLDVQYKIVKRLKSDVANCSFNEVVRSRKFREGFVSYLSNNCRIKDMRQRPCTCESVQEVCKLAIKLPRLMEVVIEPAPVHISYNWSSKLMVLARRKEALEEAMAQLSTLGGGYSSLGDYFSHFSEKAGKLSVTQLKVAMEMGDPVMASRCRLFFALSLMQRGQLVESRKIIRNEYGFATQLMPKDNKLIDMCKGLWSKLLYLTALKKHEQPSSVQIVELPSPSATSDSAKSNTSVEIVELPDSQDVNEHSQSKTSVEAVKLPDSQDVSEHSQSKTSVEAVKLPDSQDVSEHSQSKTSVEAVNLPDSHDVNEHSQSKTSVEAVKLPDSHDVNEHSQSKTSVEAVKLPDSHNVNEHSQPKPSVEAVKLPDSQDVNEHSQSKTSVEAVKLPDSHDLKAHSQSKTSVKAVKLPDSHDVNEHSHSKTSVDAVTLPDVNGNCESDASSETVELPESHFNKHCISKTLVEVGKIPRRFGASTDRNKMTVRQIPDHSVPQEIKKNSESENFMETVELTG